MSDMTINDNSLVAEPLRPKLVKVSDSERLLYGDLAGVVRQVGNATVELHDAMRNLSAFINESRRMGEMVGDEAYVVPELEVFRALAPLHDELLTQYRQVCARAGELAARTDSRADEHGNFVIERSESSRPG